MKNKTVYILMGPSGSGKTTLGKFLQDSGIPELISHTTRLPRKGEVDGKTYYFVNDNDFDNLDKIEETDYTGQHRYALAKEELESKFKQYDRVFTIMDRKGAEQIKEKLPYGTVKVIYIDVSLRQMMERMKKRGDKDEDILIRIDHAQRTNEFQNIEIADYVIENNNLEEAVNHLLSIVAAA